MDSLTPDRVPAISTLVNAFGVYDGYHASVPGPTFPNRLFMLSATSHGFGDNDPVQTAFGWPQRSIFAALNATPGLTDPWRVYFSDVPSALLLADARNLSDLAAGRYRFFQESFAADAAKGDFASFTWIEPSFLDIPGIPATDEHPAHDVLDGERFIKEVYDAVRNSPAWNQTVLFVTYDEHGGFYDHVPPPVVGVPSPDGLPCGDCAGTPFDFTRLGVRVPMVVASPFVPAGSVVHAAAAPSAYDHASLSATLAQIFPGYPFPLTRRDAWALPLLDALTLDAPRVDAPRNLTVPAGPSPSLALAPRQGANAVNDLQRSLLTLVEGARAPRHPTLIAADLAAAGALASEAAAGLHARALMRAMVDGARA